MKTLFSVLLVCWAAATPAIGFSDGASKDVGALVDPRVSGYLWSD